MIQDRSEIDRLGAELAAAGWRITAQRGPQRWTACLHLQQSVSIDDFYGNGDTCLEAMRAAIAERDKAITT